MQPQLSASQPQTIGEKQFFRIGMVLDEYESLNGTVISSRRFAQLLTRRGHEVVFLTTGPASDRKIIFKEWRPPVFRRQMTDMKVHLAVPDIHILSREIPGLDVLHIQFPFWLGKRSVDVATRSGVPVVATFHVQAEHILKNTRMNNSLTKRLLYRYFLSSIYNRADKVICPSKFAAEELGRFGLRKPYTVISNGVPADFRKLEISKPAEWRDKFVLLSVGRLAREKRHDLIIRALAQSRHEKQVQLVILGEGPLKNDLLKQASQLTNPVHITTCQGDKLVEMYNMADLYVHAAEIEVECMSALEAISCGVVPLISDSPLSATRQFAKDDRSLFPAGQSDLLCQKIDYWFEHPDQRREMQNQYISLAGRYSIATSADQLEKVYRSVVKTHR